MRKKGMPDEDIVEELANKNHTYQEISEALNQADLRSFVNKPSFPSPGQMQESSLSRNEDIPAPSPNESSEEPARIPITTRINPVPSVQLPPQIPSLSSGDVQELIESIIEDRWQQVVTSVGDISLWKAKVEDDLSAVKQEILRVEDRMSHLQASLLGRVDEYSKSISRVGSEVAALEKVFEKIMDPLTSNIKELNRITSELKKK